MGDNMSLLPEGMNDEYVVVANANEPQLLELIRLSVPLLQAESREDPRQLVWRLDSKEGQTIAESWGLAEFLRLAEAADWEIREFARKHGPLGGSRNWLPTGSAPTTLSESTAQWRGFAWCLLALLEADDRLRMGRDCHLKQWFLALDAPRLALAIRQGAEQPLDQHWSPFAGERWSKAKLNEIGRFYPPTAAGLHEIVEALLLASGIKPLVEINGFRDGADLYAVEVRRLTGSELAPSRPGFIVDGLLPVLALQTRYSRTIGGRRCSECGRFIPFDPNAKKPRWDRPFYGTHEHCRRQARLRSKRASQKRRYQRMRDA